MFFIVVLIVRFELLFFVLNLVLLCCVVDGGADVWCGVGSLIFVVGYLVVVMFVGCWGEFALDLGRCSLWIGFFRLLCFLWRWGLVALAPLGALLAILGASRTCSCCSWRSSFLQAFFFTELYLVFRVRALPCGAFGAVFCSSLSLWIFMMLVAIGGKFFSVAYSFASALWGMALFFIGVVSWSTCSWLLM